MTVKLKNVAGYRLAVGRYEGPTVDVEELLVLEAAEVTDENEDAYIITEAQLNGPEPLVRSWGKDVWELVSEDGAATAPRKKATAKTDVEKGGE